MSLFSFSITYKPSKVRKKNLERNNADNNEFLNNVPNYFFRKVFLVFICNIQYAFLFIFLSELFAMAWPKCRNFSMKTGIISWCSKGPPYC